MAVNTLVKNDLPAEAVVAAYREVAAIIARFTKEDGIHETAVGTLFFNRRSSPSQPLHVAQAPCFALVAQGAKSLTLGAEVFRYGVGDYLLVSLDVPVASRVTQASAAIPHLGLGLTIDSGRLGELLGRISIPVPPMPSDMARSVAVNAATPALLDATVRLLRLLDRPADIPALAPLVEQEILYHLLTGPGGPQLLRLAMTDSPSHRVSKAVAWLRQHVSEHLRIAVLADLVGMSRSSLHQHFKALTGMSPLQYQKHLRLQEARRLMVMEDINIADASYRVGYESPSQFSREYRRLFGTPPHRDVGRLSGAIPEAAA
jgi:AraC-like DNA-binding protein